MSEQKIKADNAFKKIMGAFVKAQGNIKKIVYGYIKQGQQWEAFFKGLEVPAGTIVPFDGFIADIPEGWVFCDGNNGAPDLRDRFILGSGSDEGQTGGSEAHTHAVSSSGTHTHAEVALGQHRHPIIPGSVYGVGKGMLDWTLFSTRHTHDTLSSCSHVHDASSESSLPPYVTLVYIMKL